MFYNIDEAAAAGAADADDDGDGANMLKAAQTNVSANLHKLCLIHQSYLLAGRSARVYTYCKHEILPIARLVGVHSTFAKTIAAAVGCVFAAVVALVQTHLRLS